MRKKVKIKSIKGFIYVEGFNGKHNEEEDRAKIYDENINYIDYIVLDGRTKKEYNRILSVIKNSKNFEDFIENVSAFTSYDYSESLEYLLNSMFDNGDTTQEEFDEVEKDIKTLKENELIEKYELNRVGNYYFYLEG